MKKIIYTLMIVWMGMTACTPSVENPTMVNRKPSIYPDYIGVTIPADIAPMNFNIKGDTVDVVSRTSVAPSLLPSVPVRMVSGSNIRISR